MAITTQADSGTRNIVISGYYGYRNFGDEALLAALSLLLISQGIEPRAITADVDDTSTRHGISASHRNDWRARSTAVAGSDAVILGGGSLIKDMASWGGASAGLALIDLIIGAVAGRRCIAYAVGTGKIRHPRGWRYVGRILSCCDLVVVRDRRSLRELQEHGVKDRVVLGADLLFAARPTDETDLHTTPSSGLRVAISLSASELGDPEEGVISALASAVAALCQRRPVAQVLLLVLQDSEESSDRRVLEPLRLRLQADGLAAEVADLSAADAGLALRLIAQADLVVAMRYHALVLALVSEVPVVAVADDAKVSSLLEEFGGERYLVTRGGVEPTRLHETMEAALDDHLSNSAIRRETLLEMRSRIATAEQALLRTVAQGNAAHLLRRVRAGAILVGLGATLVTDHLAQRCSTKWRAPTGAARRVTDVERR